MSGLKRVGILIAVAAVALVFSASFEGSGIQERAIIIGIGVDCGDGDGIELTAEVVSPGNGQEQIGLFSKTVSATGASVGDAIAELWKQVGKKPSLGQCGVLIFGEDFYRTRELRDVTDFFAQSGSFRENSVICCSVGSARELLDKSEALTSSVSLAITSALKEQAKKVAVPSNTLLDFVRSQQELSQSGFLNLVEFVPSENVDDKSQKAQGFFVYDKTAIFSSYGYLCELSDAENMGFSLLYDEVRGNMFSCKHEGRTYALRVNGKKIKKELVNNGVSMDVILQVRLARAGATDVGGEFTVKDDRELSNELLQTLEVRAAEYVEAFLQRQAEESFDIIDLHELIRQRQGTSDELCALPTGQIDVTFSVRAEEK